MDYKIIEMLPEDAYRLTGLVGTLENLSEVGALNEDKISGLIETINRQNGHLYVAVTGDNRIIGAVTLHIEQKIIHGGGLSGRIEDLAVHPEYEHNGVGSSLMSEAEDQAIKRGCYKRVLTCQETLVRFYKDLGFYRRGASMRNKHPS
ncbi:MAG TPA: GNAT family N-acetyltransferase [Candidatus Nanoarchaeia archaeon]|nr:GNAT family N-acetyltransferase [Candidatus Nanoarchaeia archaeon]